VSTTLRRNAVQWGSQPSKHRHDGVGYDSGTPGQATQGAIAPRALYGLQVQFGSSIAATS
jgi:hypothetical protein